MHPVRKQAERKSRQEISLVRIIFQGGDRSGWVKKEDCACKQPTRAPRGKTTLFSKKESFRRRPFSFGIRRSVKDKYHLLRPIIKSPQPTEACTPLVPMLNNPGRFLMGEIERFDGTPRTLNFTYKGEFHLIIHVGISERLLVVLFIVICTTLRQFSPCKPVSFSGYCVCSTPVVSEPSKVSAEPAWRIRGIFLPA